MYVSSFAGYWFLIEIISLQIAILGIEIPDEVTSINIARAWSFKPHYIDIYSNSWGYNTQVFYQPRSVEIQAVSEGIRKVIILFT